MNLGNSTSRSRNDGIAIGITVERDREERDGKRLVTLRKESSASSASSESGDFHGPHADDSPVADDDADIVTANPPAKNHGNHGILTKLTTLTVFCAPFMIPTTPAHIRRGSKAEKKRPTVQHWKDKKQFPTKRCIPWFLSGQTDFSRFTNICLFVSIHARLRLS
jgi:hypothetical protein